MKGGIYTSQRCPLCGGALIHDERRSGLFCEKHPEQRASSFRVKFGKVFKRFKDYESARRFLTGLRYETDKGTFDARDYKRDNPLGFEVQTTRFLKIKEAELSRNGYRDLARPIGLATDLWGGRNVKTIGYGDIEDFLFGLKVGAKTRHNYKSALHNFFTWLSRREGIPVPEMPECRFELGWRPIIDMETQGAILDKIHELTWKQDPKIWLGIKWLCTYVSIRPNELRNLHEREIDVDGLLVIPSPKDDRPKLVPMIEEDIELYRSLPRGLPDLYFFRHPKGNGGARPGQQYSREMFYRNWKRACSSLGIEGVDLYGGTRHSTSTALAAHFGRDELRDHGTMHGSNRAFDRYVQGQVEPRRNIYESARGLNKGKRGKVLNLDKEAKDGNS